MTKIENAVRDMVQCSIGSTSTSDDFKGMVPKTLESVVDGYEHDTFGCGELSNGIILPPKQYQFTTPNEDPYDLKAINDDPMVQYGKEKFYHSQQIILFDNQRVIEKSSDKAKTCYKYQSMYHGYNNNPQTLVFCNILPVNFSLTSTTTSTKFTWITLIRNGHPFTTEEIKAAQLYFPQIIACLNARIANVTSYHKMLGLAQKHDLTSAEFRLLLVGYTILNTNPGYFSTQTLISWLGISQKYLNILLQSVLKKITGKKCPNPLNVFAYEIGKLSS